jgi:hypothetical protein
LRRYYLSRAGPATGSAVILDVCVWLKLIDARQQAMLERVVSMLIKLTKRLDVD